MSALVDRLHALRRVLDGLVVDATSPDRPAAGAAQRDREGSDVEFRPEGPSTEAELVHRLLDRLDRDLLPRTRLGDDWLVCAIVGPNNAGKSALFNGLCGRDVSPSVATGAATRRLVAAANPALCDELFAEAGHGRFDVRPWEDPTSALSNAERPDELLLARVDSMPERVLLIDAPDFDSVELANRAAAEAVLAAADVAICVVTKHTYQNAQVVDFLKGWLAGGRPWIAVYNELPTEEIARSHLAKLAADLGTPPLARFGSPYDHAVSEGTRPLAVADLDGGERVLKQVLAETDRRAEWKRAALAASMSQLAVDAERLARLLEERGGRLERAHAAIAHQARRSGEEVARVAMPAQPFLAAFLAVIDRRRNPLRRRWHGAVRAVTLAPAAIGRAFGRRERVVEPIDANLIELESRALGAATADFVETLGRTIGPAASDEGARRDAEFAAALDRDLARSHDEVLRAVRARHAAAVVDVEGFQAVCEGLVERALEERGRDGDIQAYIDLATLVPAAAAAATIVLTGGFGVDLAVASGGLVTTALMGKYSHLLDRGIAREARRLWEERRGGELGDVLVRAATPESADLLARERERCLHVGSGLRTWLEEGA
ncbi:Dynamin family protein [Planctomycetes bacterium Pla163]|uniref:Dynamin family protein n=1 Tax=Rohdeia mirabilis TaxID=2528008 RepID=A0A518D1Y5_9BACT|nr:Dynamin family protein [Planctomycetes bacterium Pla163]